MASVLIFCPTYEENGRDMVHGRTLDAIKALEWGGKSEFVLSKVNPYSDGKLNVLHQYQHARKLLLAGKHDAILTVEHDMIPPPDALDKLWAMDTDVAYGVYLLRHGAYMLNTWRIEGRRYVGQSYSLFPEQLKHDTRDSEIVEISGVGFGCTLIKRHVLEKLELHPAESGHPIPDVPFSNDCLRNGYTQLAHFGVICGHIEPGGNVLWWPENTGDDMLKVFVLQDVNVSVNEQTMYLKAGDKIDLPEYTARELARAGYIRVNEKEREPKAVRAPRKRANG